MSSAAAEHFVGIEQFEAGLWKIADDLRANSGLASNEYSMPIMGLLFLRHASNRYYTALAAIEADKTAGTLTLKVLHAKRGIEAIEAIGIIPRYGGVQVTGLRPAQARHRKPLQRLRHRAPRHPAVPRNEMTAAPLPQSETTEPSSPSSSVVSPVPSRIPWIDRDNPDDRTAPRVEQKRSLQGVATMVRSGGYLA